MKLMRFKSFIKDCRVNINKYHTKRYININCVSTQNSDDYNNEGKISPLISEDLSLSRITVLSSLDNHFKLYNPNAVLSPNTNKNTSPPIISSVISSSLSEVVKPGFVPSTPHTGPSVIYYLNSSLLLFTHLALLWQPEILSEITVESLKLIEILEPKPELIIFGTGKQVQELPEPIVDYLQSINIAYDVADTLNAVATFNLLNDEKRLVCAAVLKRNIEPQQIKNMNNDRLSLSSYHSKPKPSAALRQKLEQELKNSLKT
jgi:uncharacterized protein